MKRSMYSISKEYDEAYKKAQAIFDKHKVCNITKSKNGTVSCAHPIYGKDNGLCCEGCRHLSKNGCKVKALDCKLWICSHFRDHPITKELHDLRTSLSKEVRVAASGCRTPKSKIIGYFGRN